MKENTGNDGSTYAKALGELRRFARFFRYDDNGLPDEIDCYVGLVAKVADRVRENQCCPKGKVPCAHFNEYIAQESPFPCMLAADSGFEPKASQPWRCANHEPDWLLEEIQGIEALIENKKGYSSGDIPFEEYLAAQRELAERVEKAKKMRLKKASNRKQPA